MHTVVFFSAVSQPREDAKSSPLTIVAKISLFPTARCLPIVAFDNADTVCASIYSP